MGFLRRRATGPASAAASEPLVPTFEDAPFRLVVVFETLPSFDQERLRRAIADVDPRLAAARAEIVSEALEATTHGLVGWGTDEVVHVDGYTVRGADPVAGAVVEELLQHAELDPGLSARVRAAKGHVVLTYQGRTPAPEVRFLALAAVAAAVGSLPGALVVGSRDARTAIPIARLRKAAKNGLQGLRSLPRSSLAYSISVSSVPGRIGEWARTRGATRFGLPDLARWFSDPAERAAVRRLLIAVEDYVTASGTTIRAGDHLDAGEARLTARAPRPDEAFLDSPGTMLVLDNRRGG